MPVCQANVKRGIEKATENPTTLLKFGLSKNFLKSKSINGNQGILVTSHVELVNAIIFPLNIKTKDPTKDENLDILNSLKRIKEKIPANDIWKTLKASKATKNCPSDNLKATPNKTRSPIGG